MGRIVRLLGRHCCRGLFFPFMLKMMKVTVAWPKFISFCLALISRAARQFSSHMIEVSSIATNGLLSPLTVCSKQVYGKT